MTEEGMAMDADTVAALDWWKRDGHATSNGAAADAASDCGCN
jgi:hypothetical protein